MIMKTKTLLLSLLSLFLLFNPLNLQFCYSYSFTVNGIYYQYLNYSNKTVTVTYQRSTISWDLSDVPSGYVYETVYDNDNGDYYEWYWSDYSGDITIPSSVTYNGITYQVKGISEYAFMNCMNVTSVIIPQGIGSIGKRAFWHCGLSSVTIGGGILPQYSSAFENCSNLSSVVFSNNGVQSIPENAFFNCPKISSLTIGNSVNSIDPRAFPKGSLASIVVDSNNNTYDSRNGCNAIINKNTNELIIGGKNTVIPNSVTSIGDRAFWRCSGLKSIAITNSVTSIGMSAFYDSGLTSVIVEWNSPITTIFYNNSNLFSNSIYQNATLYVPVGRKAAYQAATGWSNFSNIVE